MAVQIYIYLAYIDLHNRGLKAFFKLKKSFSELKPNVKTLLHIFDHTVKPILLYGSEVWGATLARKLNKEKELLYYKECKNIKQENLHSKFCKFALKCGKRSTNVAVLGELGRYPLIIEVFLLL